MEILEQPAFPPLRVSKPNDKIEAPIIACNDNFNLTAGRVRRPSTPNKAAAAAGIKVGGGTIRKGREEVKKQGSRIRSASAGRDHKTEVSSRYWTYLFENLERSISEIYEGCEKEENIRQCKEVILILENHTRDFTKLIEWFHLKWSYEKTPPPMRPLALAWEIRKPSLCLLPHTQAYQKLLSLRESKSSSGSKADPLESIGSNLTLIIPPLPESACLLVQAEKKGEGTPSAPNNNTNVTSTTSNNEFCVPTTTIPTTPTTTPSLTVDIGLQTDLEEDPDIFYFAGGRNVAFQTDYSEEYGPLSPTLFKCMPTILVLNTSSSDSNLDSTEGIVETCNNHTTTTTTTECDNNNTKPNQPCVALLNKKRTDYCAESNNVAELMNASSSSTSSDVALMMTISSSSSELPSEPHLTITPLCSTRPITPIETKSSSTQLSAGVLIADEASPLDKELGGGTPPSPVIQSSTPTPTPTRSTFAEKAKNGMLRQTQAQAKSVSSYLNKVGTTAGSSSTAITTVSTKSTSLLLKNNAKSTSSSSGMNGGGGGGVGSNTRGRTAPNNSLLKFSTNNKTRLILTAPVIPNYRSNIASRCRTAVNTGQLPSQPETLQQISNSTKSSAAAKSDKSINKASSSSTTTTPPSSATATPAPVESLLSNNNSNNKASSARSVSLASKSTPQSQEHSKADNIRVTGNDSIIINHSNTAGGDGVGPLIIKQIAPPPPTVVSFSTTTTISSSKPAGIIRSKSMINPFIPSSSSGVGSKRFNEPTTKENIKSTATGPKRTNSSFGGMKGSSSFKRLHSNSFVSLPDETTREGKSHMIDADGWETVKARSNRSKWSSSNSSLGSSNANQSRNSLDKGTPNKPGTVISKPATTPTTIPPGSESSTKKPNSSTEEKKSTTLIPTTKNSKTSGGDLKKKNSKSTDRSSEDGPTTNSPTTEDDGTQDDEEIKKKEADLDDAIRQEELLEEELMQVEKDFERIENDSTTEEGTITDSEHAVSPEVVDFDEMDDQFFFVSIDDQESANVEDMPPHEPGRILTLREKLMSPAKKCDGAETLKRYEAKLAKAERNREKLLQAKFNRYVELSDRFESLNETTKKLLAERSELILKAEERRKRAAEKRQEYIKSIQRKGHDEDLKAKEIAFINLLGAQNKRHDYFASAQEVEGRLQTMHDERRLKLEERSGKASSVIARQSRIRKDWQVKLTTLQEKRRKANERVTREKEERAKERSEIAQEKARDREGRISALNAAKQAEKEELQKKIKQKQEETARRHEENMEQIRQKAIELSAPRVQEENAAPTSCRVCTLCNVIIHSGIHEMQHIRSRGHLDAVKKSDKSSSGGGVDMNNVGNGGGGGGGQVEGFGFKFIADVQTDKIDKKIQPDRNRNRALKKHSKKLMQKLMESGLEFEKSIRDDQMESKSNNNYNNTGGGDPKLKSKIRKNILELDRLISLFINNKGTAALATSMDRIMAEIRRTSVQNIYIKDCIIGMNGLEVALKVLQCQAVDLPAKSKIHAIEMIHGFILGSLVNGLYILRGTGICTLMNLCAERWSTLIPDDNRWLCTSPLGSSESLPTDYFIQSVVELLFNVLEYVPDPFKGILKKGSFLTQDEIHSIKNRTFDIIGYLVTSGVVDRISVYCSGVRGPVDEQPAVALLLRVFIDFLVVLVYTLQFCWGENPTGCILQKKEHDGTQLLAALEASELAGAVSMSYSLLIHQKAPTRPRTETGDKVIPPPPGEKTAEVVKSTLCLINAMARLDLLALQNVLASEAVSLQFRHIASQLLWQVVPHRQTTLMRRLLTELIISIGNFTVGNKHNQATIQSGQNPTVLQLLCTLPQEYFTDPRLKHNFIPTLLAATQGCQENMDILLQNNVNIKMLDDYLTSDDGKKNVFVRRMIFVTAQQQQQSLAATHLITSSTNSNKGHAKKVKNHQNNKENGTTTIKAIVKPLEESNITVVN